MDQPSRSTNTNNTDTSSATRLDPAPDAEARQAQEGWGETSQLNAGSQLGKESGVGPTYNTSSSGGSSNDSSGGSGASENTKPAGGSAQSGSAPGYASHPAPSMGDESKPKGQNITEGGFDSDAPNASFNTDIGGKNDPGRVALGKMEASDTPVSGGAGAKQQEVTGDTHFDALGGDAEA